jgi:hypothetical protein
MSLIHHQSCDTCENLFKTRPGFRFLKMCKIAEREIPFETPEFLTWVGCSSYKKKEGS